MLGSLLIANRGEIARRIIRTCRRLNVRSIAVFSEADADSPFVREADEAVAIGPPAAKESYLRGDRILDAARRTQAEAIHPGYGFLSENAAFAQSVIDAGLIWVGPPPAAIEAMGLKDAAKALMERAGVPVTPGYLGADQSEPRLAEEAARIGFPILIKAVAGGGGKGMRRVERAADFAAALASCRREAQSAFGDDRVLLETYVRNPRHIEVQVFADRHGNVVHLFERDCSLQRRHQKVVEEAPAPGMTPAVREAICAAAVQAARAVGYEGAGTVEFIADGSAPLSAERIWFMEMNTRLQVEHPVTEAITGQDLVEWQLRVASGEQLPLRQGDLWIDGHAVEARLYAESPASGFLPSIGPLRHFRLPEDDLRIDSAVEQGSEVTPWYDPMIAKLIAHGRTREAALARLAAACRKVEIWPVKTNAGFLARLVAHPDFGTGAVDTGFIEAHLADLLPPPLPPRAVLEHAAAARVTLTGLPRALAGFRVDAAPRIAVQVEIDGERRAVDLPSPLLAVPPAGFADDEALIFFAGGDAWRTTAPANRAGARLAEGDGTLRSPMPGLILAVFVSPGERVAKGTALLVLEAMKMEHSLTAPFDGIVAEISVSRGDRVAERVVLARLEPAA
jgi:propionyl-CoA carboxylase alpha chain/3-methylcrotonyl-CoA carboxylase alpha subunit